MERVVNSIIISITLMLLYYGNIPRLRSCDLFIDYMYNHETIFMYYWDYSESITC